MAEEQQGSRAGEWYAAGLLSAYAAVVFLHRGVPSLTDYANWTYQGMLLRDHLVGRPDLAHVLKHYPVPNSAATMGIGLLGLALPWMLAAKLWLCVQLAVTWRCMRHLLRAVQADVTAWVVTVQAVYLDVNLWYGFVNFQLGICWVMLMVSLLLGRRRGEGGRGWWLGGVLLLAFFTHMIPFAVCALLLVLYAAQTKEWRLLWQLGPSLAVSVWYVLGRFLMAGDADGKAGMQATVRDYSAGFWLFKANSYAKSLGFVNPMGMDEAVFGRWGLRVLLLLTAALAVVAGGALVRAVWVGVKGRGQRERFVWMGLLGLVPVFLLAPGTALGVSDPGARVLQVGLGLGLALCWRGVGVTARRVAAGCAVVLSGAGLWLFVVYGGALGQPLKAGPESGRGASRFVHVPSTDQDYFYAALEHGEMGLRVFPTGMFLNR